MEILWKIVLLFLIGVFIFANYLANISWKWKGRKYWWDSTVKKVAGWLAAIDAVFFVLFVYIIIFKL